MKKTKKQIYEKYKKREKILLQRKKEGKISGNTKTIRFNLWSKYRKEIKRYKIEKIKLNENLSKNQKKYYINLIRKSYNKKEFIHIEKFKGKKLYSYQIFNTCKIFSYSLKENEVNNFIKNKAKFFKDKIRLVILVLKVLDSEGKIRYVSDTFNYDEILSINDYLNMLFTKLSFSLLNYNLTNTILGFYVRFIVNN